MGYALLYESMLDTVLLARDKYLVSAMSERRRGAGRCGSGMQRS
jgi:hypothetical protein